MLRIALCRTEPEAIRGHDELKRQACLPVPAIGVLYNALMTEMSLRIGGIATLLQVFDMPTSLSFYRNVLGLDVVSEVPDDGRFDWVMLKRFESELMLKTAYEANTRPPAPEPMRILMQAG
jgi:hypothetical protein